MAKFAFWGTLVFLVVIVGLYYFGDYQMKEQVVPMLIFFFISLVVAIVLVYLHDNKGWPGWLIAAIPMAVFFVSMMSSGIQLSFVHPPVQLAPNTCSIVQNALGTSWTECPTGQALQEAICFIIPDKFGEQDCKTLFRYIEADINADDQTLASFQQAWSEYSVAKATFIQTRFTVTDEQLIINILTLLGVLLLISLLGLASILSRYKEVGVLTMAVGFVAAFVAFIVWKIAYKDVSDASTILRLLLSGGFSGLFLGNGALMAFWRFAGREVEDIFSGKARTTIAVISTAVGIFLSSPLLQFLWLSSTASNFVAADPLMSMGRVQTCLVLGSVIGGGVLLFITWLIGNFRRKVLGLSR